MALPPTGLIGSEQALQQGLTSQLGLIGQGIGSAQGEIDRATGQAVSTLNPYTQGGGGASQIQAALSGAMGPQAQQQAFQNYQNSPGQQYALEQGRRNLLQGASATGGLGGGNVQRELMRQGIGMAQQNYQNDFNNLGMIANRGMGVAGQQAGLQAQAGNNLSNLALQGGIIPAQAVGNTANMLAQGRFNTGQLLAGQAANTTTGLANLQNQQGTGMANQYGQANTNIGNLVSQAGQGSSNLQQNLATILANIGTQSGSQQANYTSAAGQYDAAGILGQNQAVQNTLGQLIQMIPQGGYGGGSTAPTSTTYNPSQSGVQFAGTSGMGVA